MRFYIKAKVGCIVSCSVPIQGINIFNDGFKSHSLIFFEVFESGAQYEGNKILSCSNLIIRINNTAIPRAGIE